MTDFISIVDFNCQIKCKITGSYVICKSTSSEEKSSMGNNINNTECQHINQALGHFVVMYHELSSETSMRTLI